MVLTFPDVQTAIGARHKRAIVTVLINGVVTPVYAVTTRYGVKEPIGTCTLTLDAPLPDHVAPNATVEVQMGYPGVVRRTFLGTIPGYDRTLSMDGDTLTINAVSTGNRLTRQDYRDWVYPGPVQLRDLFLSVCARRRVAQYRSDATVYVNQATGLSVPITFGNVAEANENKVTIARKTTSLSALNEMANLFGFYVFDTAEGVVQKRISGAPNEDAVLVVEEAWNVLQAENRYSIADLTNYWEFLGAKYTDAEGGTVMIRSIADHLPDEPLLAPDGWRRNERSSPLVDTLSLADAARNTLEIDNGAPFEQVSWTTHCAPNLQPGDVVMVNAPTIGQAGKVWLMSVEHSWNASDGLLSRCQGWRGGGVALPAGSDIVTTLLHAGPIHVGDERVPWYAVPSPSGKEFKLDFVVLENYSYINVRYLGHGSNSYLLDGANYDSSVTRFTITQNGEEVASGNLLVLNEDYPLQRDYTQDINWTRAAAPMPGDLKPGIATFAYVAGKDSKIGEPYTYDDSEAKAIWLETGGTGNPLVGEGIEL